MKTLLMMATYGLEIGECGGTLAKHARAGDRVYASVTLARPEYREQIRRAAAILGITDVRFLDFSYGEVSADTPSKAKLVALLRELRPDIVITQDPEHCQLDLDPDRREAMTLYLEALALSSRDWRTDECGAPHSVKSIYFMTPEHPNCLIDISEVFELKERAVAELKGQLEFTARLFRQRVSDRALRALLPDYDALRDDPIALGRALHREMHRAYDLYYGIWSHSSLVLAEPFRRLSPIELELLL
ncbi:MAG: GlcNAc-PI de-N-acetylase [Candidatus Bipolaricaulota bacterium]|nr:GlcNAc-PI de-N-acetylase [Candidatus Bipolaricaulota bacterium]MDW8031622.1 GlcNAc-PI de-N-acetylase [Candidatus Bipolaricaulota bacterium]